MAKVTIIIEDIESPDPDNPRLRIEMESDNKSDEITPAEIVAEQLLSFALAGTKSTDVSPPGEDPTLN
jgi:hypothetical protein